MRRGRPHQIGFCHTGVRGGIAVIKRERFLEEGERGPRAAGSRILERELPTEIELARFSRNSLGLRRKPGQHLGNNQAHCDGNDGAGRSGRPRAHGTRAAFRN